MTEYNPSKIIKDGNTYNFRDTTKIPLAGSNQISGDLIPSTDGTVNLGGSSYQWNNAYIKSLTINGVACGDILTHNVSEFVPRSGGTVMTGLMLGRDVNDSELRLDGGTGWDNGASLSLSGKDRPDLGLAGAVILRASDGSQSKRVILYPNGIFMLDNKNVAMYEDVIPRSGGAVIDGYDLCRTANDGYLAIFGGSNVSNGGGFVISGADRGLGLAGAAAIQAADNAQTKTMLMYPSGTWTWNGTACQITSDQRLKQQITEIDDKLLDAWESVELCQFKYNDAVDQKKDKARLHTGYVVQQIDNACKSHGVDVSAYGLYCHEEYPQETEEVEVENEDGTKVKERKVIREASEHYSLRYTEVYAVECMYLRRCIAKLTARIEELEKGNNSK